MIITKKTNFFNAAGNFQLMLIEDTDAIYIDGYGYDKVTLAPIPFKKLTSYNQGYSSKWHVLGIQSGRSYNQHWTSACSGNAEAYSPDLCPSRVNRGVNYSNFGNSLYTTSAGDKLCLPTAPTTTWFKNEVNVGDPITTLPNTITVLDETPTAIIFALRTVRSDSSPNNWTAKCGLYIGYIIKATMVATNILTLEGSYGTLVYKDANFLWVGAATLNGVYNVYSINRGTFVYTSVLSYTPTNGTTHCNYIPSQAFIRDNGALVHYNFINDANAAPKFKMYGIEAPISGAAGTKTLCTVDWQGTDPALQFPVSGFLVSESYRFHTETFIITSATKKYVASAFTVATSYGSAPIANQSLYKLHIWEIPNPTTAPYAITYRGNMDLSSTYGQLRNVLPFDSTWSTVYFIFDSKIIPGVFNETNNNYTLQTPINLACKSFGLDSLDRAWAIDQNNNLHLLSTTLVSNIAVTFAQASYSYTGNAISTSINVSAYNYQGNRVVANVAVTFDSPNAKFSDNSTTKIITTSASADVNQAITITGAGEIKLHSNIQV